MNQIYIYIMLFISIFLGAMGQIFMKLAMNQAGPFPVSQISLWYQYFLKVFFNPNLFLVFLSYGVSILLWLVILSYKDLSWVRPLMSLGYLVTLIYGFFYGENVNFERILGTFLIILGVFFITKS